MRLYRVMVYRRGNLEIDVAEQAGEVLDVAYRDGWPRQQVLTDTGSGFDRTPDWRTSRREALEIAIAQVESAQANAAAVLDDLRNRLLTEHHRPLPAAAAAGSGESAAGGRDVTPAA